MCDLGQSADHKHFGFLVDTPEIRALIAETQRLNAAIADPAARVEALRPAFGKLLAAPPVHDHLAWGLVGIYRGRQDETVYRRLDDGRDASKATLEVAKRQELGRGEFYPLLPPTDDIHFVRTISETASISIHLLANDTACVWRHKFDPGSGVVTPFRSGYANAPCPDEAR